MTASDPRGSSSGSHFAHALSNRGRIAIFIDGNNLFHAARSAGVEIDYAKLLAHLRGDDPLLRAFFYTGVDQQAERQQGFLLWMRRNGYRVVQKELKTFPDGTKKANLDVEIAVDMLSLADKYDTAILVSGDEDFTYALNVIAYKGVRVEVAGFRANTSPRLIDVADRFHELDGIVTDISKLPSKRDSQQAEALRASGEWSSSPEASALAAGVGRREAAADQTAGAPPLAEQPSQPPIQGDLPEHFEATLDSRNATEAEAPVITEDNVIVGTLHSGDYRAIEPEPEALEASETPALSGAEAEAAASGDLDPVAQKASGLRDA